MGLARPHDKDVRYGRHAPQGEGSGEARKLSVADALRAIRFAETVVIVFDATIPFEKQDLQIVDLVLREGVQPCLPSTNGISSRTGRHCS